MPRADPHRGRLNPQGIDDKVGLMRALRRFALATLNAWADSVAHGCGW